MLKHVLVVAAALAAAWSYKQYEKQFKYEWNFYTTGEEAIEGMNLTGKVVVVTGSNGGIGRETARVLARQGATVIMACRTVAKADKARQEMLDADESIDGDKLVVMQLDVSSLSSVRKFSEELVERYSGHGLHYLVNNAGISQKGVLTTVDGYEGHFATNHLGHFYLTTLLLPTMLRTAGKSAVIALSSSAASYPPKEPIAKVMQQMDDATDGPGADLQDVTGMGLYILSKAFNILHSREIAHRYGNSNDGVDSVSVDPGTIRTGIGGDNPVVTVIYAVAGLLGEVKSIEQGAATTVRCVALAEKKQLASGSLYRDCRVDDSMAQYDVNKARLEEAPSHEATLDHKLWELSEKLITAKGFDLSL